MDSGGNREGTSQGGGDGQPQLHSSGAASAAAMLGGAERCLVELQEHHEALLREQIAQRAQRSDWCGRLVRLEQELQSEERIGRDLQQRVEILQAAILKERVLQQEFIAPPTQGSHSDPHLPTTLDDEEVFRGAQTTPTPSEALAAYLENLRWPANKGQSCRSLLRTRLRAHGLGSSIDDGELQPTWSNNGGNGSAATHDGRGDDGGRDPWGIGLGYRDDELDGTSASRRRPSLCDSNGLPYQTTWSPKFSLHGHLDGVRSIYSTQADTLISCGEDCSVNIWSLRQFRKGASQQALDTYGPYATMRGHNAPVLCCAFRPHDGILFTGLQNGTLSAWTLPPISHDAYSSNLTAQRSAWRAGMLAGHQDAIWSIDVHPHLPFLVSASADGTVAMWPSDEESLASGAGSNFSWGPSDNNNNNSPVSEDVTSYPAAAHWLPWATSQVFIGYGGDTYAPHPCTSPTSRRARSGGSSGLPETPLVGDRGRSNGAKRISIFDVQEEKKVFELRDTGGIGAVNAVCPHQLQHIVALAHADGAARLFDPRCGRVITSLSDHDEAVTGVCFEEGSPHLLATSSHDGCVRSFDLRKGRSRQRLWLHRQKYDEAIHCLHHGNRFLATGGADGTITLLMPAD